MKGSAGIRLAGALTMAAGLGILGGAPYAFGGKAPKPAAPVTSVTLRVFHRVFHDFSEDDKVEMNEEFRIGDTDFSAAVFDYVPDFVMVMDSTNKVGMRVMSRSNEPNNPAFHIVVKEKGVAQDTVWAFLNMAPHFARKSMLGFQIRRIDFKGHSPIVNKDKPATAPPAAGAPHGTAGGPHGGTGETGGPHGATGGPHGSPGAKVSGAPAPTPTPAPTPAPGQKGGR